jgi:hypothetical protein
MKGSLALRQAQSFGRSFVSLTLIVASLASGPSAVEEIKSILVRLYNAVLAFLPNASVTVAGGST